MTKVRESSTTAWLATIRGFFVSDEEIENESNNDKGYQDWKKANADIIDEKAIANLEKMLEHKDRKRKKESKTTVVKKEKTEVEAVEINKNQENIQENNGYEQEH